MSLMVNPLCPNLPGQKSASFGSLAPVPKVKRGDDGGVRGRIIRLWRLVEALHGAPRGMSNAQLMKRTGGSRATLYRDLTVLKAAGVPVVTDTVNSEARHRLEHSDMPALNPTPLQLFALGVARSVLVPLEGLSLVRELDALLGHTRGSGTAALPLSIAPTTGSPSPEATAAVEQALQGRRRLSFAYQSPKSEVAEPRVVDPIGLRAVEGHLYLVAFDVQKRGARTFKLPRMRDIVVLGEAAEPHPEVDEEALFADSVKAWAGPSHEVVIRIPSRLAGVAAEWPLIASQEVHDQGDGTALVRARVAGLVEAMRWVLRWGADAEVVGPMELRDRVAGELRRALTYYAGASSGQR